VKSIVMVSVLLAVLPLGLAPATSRGLLLNSDTAGPERGSDIAPVGAVDPAGRDMILWCQMPDTDTGLVVCSQIDATYPFEAWVADDYQSPSDHAVNSIRWWGGTWQSVETCQPDHFKITFYAHDGSCLPGEILYEEIVAGEDCTVVEIGTERYEYAAALGTPMPQATGQSYWLTIQAAMPFDPCGQWGWLTSLEAWGCASVLRFPLIGIEDWQEHGNGDMAFCLYSEEPVAVDRATWSGVKARYR
jgi:hypothetical protein